MANTAGNTLGCDHSTFLVPSVLYCFVLFTVSLSTTWVYGNLTAGIHVKLSCLPLTSTTRDLFKIKVVKLS